MKRILILLLALTLFPIYIYCQDEDRIKNQKAKAEKMIGVEKSDTDSKKKETQSSGSSTTNYSPDKSKDSLRITRRSFPDVSGYYAECYQKITTQYGLWKGIGKPLSKTQCQHLSVYYRLLRPANAPASSPFTHMQIVDSHGQLTTNSYRPEPITNDSDITYSWKSSLDNVCQLEKIINNGVLVQENYYNESGQLVMTFLPVFVDKRHIFGHYTDQWEVLAHLFYDDSKAYVNIGLDKNGYMSSAYFSDDKGQLKLNSDNVYMQLFENDEYGNTLCVCSANALGEPVIDKYGNCGWRYTFDSRGNTLTATCINQYGQPMRMPNIMSSNDVWNYKYTYDKWGRQLIRAYYDSIGQPDATSKGVHRYLFTYNENGRTTSCRAEGLNGKMINYNDDMAMWESHYDKDGNLTLSLTRNQDSLFSSSGCVKIYSYDKGRETMAREYNSNNGSDTTLSLMTVYHPEADTTWNYAGGRIIVYQRDKKGRRTLEAYYDLDFKPFELYSGWQKAVYIYEDAPHYSKVTEQRIDKDGNLSDIHGSGYWRDYNVQITETDSLTRTMITTYMDGNKILNKWENTWNKDYSLSEKLRYYDGIGCRGRTSKSDAFYYEAERVRDARGNVIVWRGFNEFGEPSYIQYGDWSTSSLYCFEVEGDSHYYDENGDTIPNNNELRKNFKAQLYKSFIIELTDSTGYNLGLRTGDLIVHYGDWHYGTPFKYTGYYNDMLCLETAVVATVPKTITVMRHDPVTKTSQIIDIPLPPGTPEELGFLYHINHMTTRETERYRAVIESAKVDNSSHTNYRGNKDLISFIYPYKIGSTNTSVFDNGFRRNAIVLAWEPYIGGQHYFYSYKDGSFDEAFNRNCDSIALHYTVDGKTAQRYVFYDCQFLEPENNFLYDILRSRSPIEDASLFYALSDSLQAVFDQYPSYLVSLTPHQAQEELKHLPGTTVSSSDLSRIEALGLGKAKEIIIVSVDYDSLSIEQKCYAKGILNHLDYSDYIILQNDDYRLYGHLDGRNIDEFAWENSDGVTIITGDLQFPNMKAATFNIEDSLVQLPAGHYILIQYHDWHIGMDSYDLYSNEDTESSNIIICAPIIEKKGKLKLGKTITVDLPYLLDINWEKLPEGLIFNALKVYKKGK